MDPAARFRAIFDLTYPALGRYALYRGVSRTDAEDLVGATLEVAWRKIDEVPMDDPLPWLYAVERNLLMNLRRSNHRHTTLLAKLPTAEATQAATVLGISGVAARTRLHRARRRLAAQLELDEQRRSGIRQKPDANSEPKRSVEVTDG